MTILTRIALASVCVLGSVSAAYADTADNYVGLGIQTKDSTLGVISKVTVKDIDSNSEFFDDTTLSIRPTIFFGDNTNVALPLTLNKPITDKLDGYAGVGVDFDSNGDEFGVIGVVGADYRLSRKFVANGNYKFGNSNALQLGLGFNLD